MNYVVVRICQRRFGFAYVGLLYISVAFIQNSALSDSTFNDCWESQQLAQLLKSPSTNSGASGVRDAGSHSGCVSAGWGVHGAEDGATKFSQ